MSRSLALLLGCCCALPLAAEERIADIRQGTNLSVAIAPDGTTLLVELLGQLWSLPAAGGGATALTPAGERVRHPRYSPNGELVVYQRLVDGQWDLWLLEVGTGAQRALTGTAADEREPDFTADGRAVVFAGNRTGHYCLWTITLDGGVETQLTEEQGDASFPNVSELGVIAYVLDRGAESALRVLGSNGAGSTVHASTHRLSAPTWRPGAGVVIFGEQDAPQSNRLRMLLLGEPRVLKTISGTEDLFDSRAAWVSGAEFVYAADGQLWRRELANPTRQPVHLFAASAVEVYAAPTDLPRFDSTGPRAALGVDGLVRSPDGKSTAFSALGDLWLIERGAAEKLTDDVFVELDPAFWPDGESLVFASERTGQFELWRLTLRDRRLTQLTFGALKPHRPAIRPDGKQIAFLETDGLGPWAPTRLKVIDWPSGNGSIAATGLIGAGTPTWGADARSLGVPARAVGALAASSASVHVELRTENATARTDDAAQPTLPWQPPAPPAEYVVEIGRLFDGVRGDYRRHVDMHVRDGKIAAIVGRGVLPARGPVIDARDVTVIPGLIDVHAHQSDLTGERLGRAWLAYGVTTVREIATDVREALERSESWASGRLPGPHLLITPAIGAAAPGDATGPVRAYPGIANGFGHSLFRQARELWIPRRGTLPPLAAAPTGGYEIEVSPGFMAYQDEFSRLIASSTVLAPGLGALAGLDAWPNAATQPARGDDAYRMLFTAYEQALWAPAGPMAPAVPALQQTLVRLIRGGGRVAVGSDAPLVPYGLGLHLELALLGGAGIGNDQVLRLATAAGALALGLEQQIGTLEEGKLADFVVIDGDPLARLSDTLKIVAVAKDGVWHDRQALLTRP